MQTRSIRLFYSYAQQDSALRQSLERHLKLLQRQGLLSSWHDRRVTRRESGRAGGIDPNLEAADLILLLISENFVASDYCFDVEMRRAMELHEAEEAQVIPILLRPVDNWQSAPFGQLQYLPKDGSPVTMWQNQDEAWVEIARDIRLLAEELQQRPAPPPKEPDLRRAARVKQERLAPQHPWWPLATRMGVLGLACTALAGGGLWWKMRQNQIPVVQQSKQLDTAARDLSSRPQSIAAPAARPPTQEPTPLPPVPRPQVQEPVSQNTPAVVDRAASPPRSHQPRPSTTLPAASINPEGEAHYQEALQLSGKSLDHKAIAEFRTALQKGADKQHPDIFFELAKAYEALDDVSSRHQALGYYRMAIKSSHLTSDKLEQAKEAVARLLSSSNSSE